jgi:hypothetical protein
MQAIRNTIYQTLEAGWPMTVRQVFYALASQGMIEKTERECKGTVGRLLVDMQSPLGQPRRVRRNLG